MVCKKCIDVIYLFNISLSTFLFIITAAGGHNSVLNLAGVLSKNVVTTPASVPAGKRRRRRQVHDGPPPSMVADQR